MSNEEIVRAWKDAEYRQRLNAEEQALVPEHPAGAIELTDDQLHQAAAGSIDCFTAATVCGPCTFDYICPPDTVTTLTVS